MLIFEQEPAYILHRTPYQESRYLVELLTQQHGRIRAIATVSKTKTHRQTEHYAPFRLLNISGHQKGELATLKHSDVQTIHTPTPEGYLNLCYVHELLIDLLPMGIVQPAVFTVYQSALENPDALHLRLMEHTLLHHLSLLPEYPTHAAPCYQIQQSAWVADVQRTNPSFPHALIAQLYAPATPEFLTHPQAKALCQTLIAPHLTRKPHLKPHAKSLKALLSG